MTNPEAKDTENNQAAVIFPYNLGARYAMYTNMADHEPEQEHCTEMFLTRTVGADTYKSAPEKSSPDS